MTDKAQGSRDEAAERALAIARDGPPLDVEMGIAEAVQYGWARVTGERDGEPTFTLTPKGVRHVEDHLGVKTGTRTRCDCFELIR